MPDKIKMPVEASHIMMFARAIGDDNPIYHDPQYAETRDTKNIIAPPTFARSVSQFDPSYELRPKPGQTWFGSGKNSSGLKDQAPSSGGLHAEQHFEYHQQIKPGDQLTMISREGKSWEKDSRRAGRLQFTESIYEFRNQQNDLVILLQTSPRVKSFTCEASMWLKHCKSQA